MTHNVVLMSIAINLKMEDVNFEGEIELERLENSVRGVLMDALENKMIEIEKKQISEAEKQIYAIMLNFHMHI